MADTVTTNFGLVKPEITKSVATWGQKLNDDMDAIDALLKTIKDTADGAIPKAGGVATGAVKGIAPVDDADFTVYSAVKALITNSSPKGTIVMWGGTIASIPNGFALCSGQTVNGLATPDLRDRFIMGSGTYTPGNFGGSATHNHGGATGNTALSIAQMPVHDHAVNDPGHAHAVNDPGHAHSYVSGNDTGGFAGNGFVYTYESGGVGKVTSVSGSNISIYASGTGIALFNNGGGAAHNHTIAAANHLPPFYVLAFLMRVRYPWEA